MRGICLPKIRYKNVESFNLDFLRWPVPNSFLGLFPSFFTDLLLSLPFAFHILSGCPKKLGVNYKHSLEMGP